MSATSRLEELRTELINVMTVLGIPLMPSSYDLNSASVASTGGGWQFRADLREQSGDSNVLYWLADVTVAVHWGIDSIATEWAGVRSTWTIQTTFASATWWRGRATVFDIVEDEPPSVTGLEINGEAYSWSVDVALILEP